MFFLRLLWPFGPAKHLPRALEYWREHGKREGKDSLDWFFRGFNRLGLYENFLKSTPRYAGFIMGVSIVGGFAWSQAWEAYWMKKNKGKLYKDNPYVYPPAE